MARITIKIKNLDKIRERLNRFPATTRREVSSAINQSILAIEAEAKPITPVKTGRLLGSYSFGRILSRPRTLRGRIKPDVSYAAAVHDAPGGRRLAPGTPYANPSRNKRALAGFLQVGVDRTENKVNQFFAKALKNMVRALAD